MISKRFRYSAIVAVAVFVLLPRTSIAQDLDFDAYPLRPADTSSPRDTLSSFLENMKAAIFAAERGNFDEVRRARRRASQALDFGDLPNPNSYEERTKRLIYLKEILDRILLPPFEDVPGPAEVAEGTVSKWTIPDTEITIARVEEGERAGEYLFSAATVARLHRYYRQSAHLPYKPGAAVGLLEDYLKSGLVERAGQRIRSRLKPVDASSPRALLEQFLASVNGAHALMMEADAALRAKPPTMSREEALEVERKAGLLIERAVGTLDLSQVPEALRADEGLETALMLKEVLDRAPLPPIESIPGARGVEVRRASGSGPIRWFFPNTDIEIAELTEGLHAGEFRFSAGTVERAAANYDKVHDLPYRGADEESGSAETTFSSDYDSPQVSAGLYQYYISTPGHLVPGTSWLGPLLTRLPDGLTALYFEQTGWQWLGIALGLLIVILAFRLVSAGGRFAGKHFASPKAEWVKLLMPIVNAVLVILLIDFINSDLNTTGLVDATVLAVGTGLVYLFAAAAAYRLCIAIAETIVSRITDKGFDASLIRLGAYVVGFLAAVVIVVTGVQQLGADVVPLLAGLGVGGLAVALAVRPTLENMIGGVILFADKPIKVGDYCTFGTQSGTVERIGLRSTRIRALDRTVITVPNAVFADMQLTNWARCDTMLITTVIGLRYETTPEQLRHVLARMRQLCFAHPKIESDTLRVRFSGFGASSLDVTVRVYALTNEWNEYHAIREDLYLRFAEIIEASGTSIAFPSSTLYVGRDTGLDADKVEAAEREVGDWRNAGQLPFPHTPEPLTAQITDSLDYPPKGSPEVYRKVIERKEERLGSSDDPESESEERLAGDEKEEHETDDASHRNR